jgi:NAD(P)-dependent dehydrogenase (short-subunit alcohol dehydrogenase family)
VLVNNAGSLGGVTRRVVELGNVADLRDYLELNVVSPIALTARVLQRVRGDGRRCTVVNVSSLLAVVPFAGCVLPSIPSSCHPHGPAKATRPSVDGHAHGHAPFAHFAWRRVVTTCGQSFVVPWLDSATSMGPRPRPC